MVRRSENFWTISRYYYQSGRYYKALWYANRDRVKAVDDLYVGTPLRIPLIEDLKRDLIEPTRTARANGRPSAEAGKAQEDLSAARVAATADEVVMLPVGDDRPSNAPKKTIPRGSAAKKNSSDPVYRSYKVRTKNETLRSIARDQLGDAGREGEVYDLNRDDLDDNDGRPRAGMTLKLPANPRE